MSGSAPTPRMFGGSGAAAATNPRTPDQMRPPANPIIGDRGQGGDGGGEWWTQAPKATSLATTTGQNLEGTTNAFDTNFWDTAAAQDREQKTLGGRWARPDATGVVTYSNADEGVEFGDVFVGGQKVGNTYKGYAGMTNTDADEVMARLVLPREVWAKAYESEVGKPLTFTGNLHDEIQAAAAKRSRDFEKGLSASQFEGEVKQTTSELEQSGLAQGVNVGAGVAGGAVTGLGAAGALTAFTGGAAAPLAPFIVGGFALAGGIGSYLNRDEALRSYAQAMEMWESASEDGHQALGYADAASGLVGAAADKLNVTRNVLHGVYDSLSEGGAGDASAAYYDQPTGIVMQGADMAALLVDGIGSFGSAAARRTYTGLMGAAAGAEQASVVIGAAEGNIAFNPYSGQYEDIGAGGMLQQQASVGIDVAQTGAAGLLGRVMNRGRAVTNETMSSGGWVVKTVDGTQQATRLGFSALIPSEAVTGLGARALARRSVRNLGIEARQNELAIQTARHLQNLSTGKASIAVIAVNGFGEGAEEFVQAVLGATAFGETPTFRELVEASKQGFAMGAGMGAALGAGARGRSQMYLDRANTMRAIRGQEQFTPAEWSAFTDSEQAQAGTATTAQEQRLYDLTVRTLVEQGSRVAAANYPELRTAVEAARSVAAKEQTNASGAVESSRLSTRSNHEWAPEDYVVSLVGAMRDVQNRRDLMAKVAQGTPVSGRTLSMAPTDEERAQAAQIAQADTALLSRLQQVSGIIDAEPAAARAAVEALNEELRSWWFATDDQAFGKRRSASVWGARFPLNAAGSFQLLRLQISPELTLAGDNNTVLVPDEIQPPTGGDFDGDRFVNQLRSLLPEDSYIQQRYGAGQLTTTGTMLAAKPYLQAQVLRLFDALQRTPGSHEHALATKATGLLAARLHALLEESPIDPKARKKLVRDLVTGLSRRNPTAVATFFQRLSVNQAPAMRELAITLDGSPYLRLNRVIENTMREFQTEVSLTTERTDRSGQVSLPATSKHMPRRNMSIIPQTSDLLMAAQETGGFDIFRVQQILKYNTRREATETSPDARLDTLAELIRTFTARNDGIIRPGEDALFDGTIAQDRVIAWLTRIAEQYKTTISGALTTNEALVLLAGADVDDVDVSVRRPRSAGSVRLAQLLLSEVVTDLRSEYAEVLGKDAAVASRLNSLEGLTRPDFMDGDHTHAQGGDAFVEILGAMPIYELLGEQGANINSWTVRSLRDTLLGLRGDVRREFETELKAHPSYPANDDGQPTPYRVLVDNVIESARMQLSETDDGLPIGGLARSSAAASKNFAQVHDTVPKIGRLRGFDMSSPASVRQFLATDVRLSVAVMSMIEERGITAGVVQRGDDGAVESVQFPQWIYDVLAEPRTKTAEMMLLRQTLINGKASLQKLDENGKPLEIDVHKVGDRILRLWLDLDFRASGKGEGVIAANDTRDAFLKLLTESVTVDQFIRGLNQNHQFRDERTPAFIAWARDRSLIEPSRFGQGVSDVQDGTEMRDALRDAAAVAATVLHDEEAVASYFEDNAQLLSDLRAARDEGTANDLWRRFVDWFELSKDRPTMVGASVWINQAGRINEILGHMGVKGVSPDNVAPLGKAIAAQLPTFDSGVGVLLSSMTSGSLGSILTDTTQLARGERTYVLNDGTVVNWQGVTPEQALDYLSDPDTAGFASRMLGMTAWDYNEDLDQNILVSIVGKGVAGFTADPAASLFAHDTESKLRRLMTLESMATTPGGPPIIPLLLAVQMNIREAALDHVISDRTGEREEMAVAILVDIADALDALSRAEGLYTRTPAGQTPVLATTIDEQTGEQLPLLNQLILDAARRARREKAVGNPLAGLLPTDPELRDLGYTLLQRWVNDHALERVEAGPGTAALQAQLNTWLQTVDDEISPLDVLLSTYSNYDDPAVRALLVRHVKASGDIANAAMWARDELLRVQDPNTPTVTIRTAAGEEALILPNLTSAQWETVARAVIAFTMHTTYGVAARSDLEIAKFPSLKKVDELTAQRSFWDPTFVEPVTDIFATNILRDLGAQPSPLLAAQLELVKRMGPNLPVVTTQQAGDAVYKLAAPKITSTEGTTSGTTGQWNALLPALMHSAQGAVLASAAESGIQMAGLSPDRLAFLAATTVQDWSRRPDDAELSTTTIPVEQLIGAVTGGDTLSSVMDVAHPDGQTRAGRLAQLEGRVVRSVRLNVNGQAYSLLGDQRYASGLLLPVQTGVLAGEAGVLSLDTLQQSISAWLLDNDVPRTRWGGVTLDVAFFHPDTKTVSALRAPDQSFDHNPWFDGVGARTDAAFSQQSLIGSFFFALDGVTPAAYETALSAIKKLTFALQQVTQMPESIRRATTLRGLTDMSGMLDQLTDFAMRQKIDKDELPLTSYNAVRKILSLLYVVRNVDETGGATVLSSEDVIALQRRGQTLSPLAEVVGLPMQHLLTLMGEQDNADMVVTPYGEMLWSPDVSRAPQYLRFPTQAWTDEMFGGLTRVEQNDAGEVIGWATGDLLDQPELRNQAIPRVRVRSRKGQTRASSRDYFGPFYKHQETIYAERGQVQGATTKWAEQRSRILHSVDDLDATINDRAFQAVQRITEGSWLEASGLLSRPRPVVKPTTDFSTAWVYQHRGRREGGVVAGVVTSAVEIGQNAAIGDVVVLKANEFVSLHGQTDPNEAFGAAVQVMREVMNVGATVLLPPDRVASELRSQMSAYLKEHDYSETAYGSGEFVPQPKAAEAQQTAAFNATLNGAQHRTSENRVLVELSEYNDANENAILSINGGIGALEDYTVRDVVQTGRFAGYGLPLSPENNQREHLLNVLLPVLQSDAGREYLATQSGIEPTDREAMAEFMRAVGLLESQLIEARANPRYKLYPVAGREFGTGDIIPYVSYNTRNELVGIHLQRYGHDPVEEKLIFGASLPDGNAALGAGGVRLTIDKGTVDPKHTTHRGSVVEHSWRGVQGSVLRVRAKLADLGSKVFEAGTGMKWTTTSAPEDHYFPTHSIFAGKPVLGAADIASPASKTADGWWLDTPSRIIETVGFDTTPYLVRLLTGVEYARDGADAYATAEREVTETLRKFSAEHRGSIDAATVVARSTEAFSTILVEQLQARLSEQLGIDAPSFFGVLTEEQTIDVTMARLVLSSLVAGAPVAEVLGAPGYIGARAGSPSHTMHPVFTTLLHQLPENHPARRAFVDQVNARMPWDGGNGYELQPNLTWKRYVTRPDGKQQVVPVVLAFPEMRATDTNDALTEMGAERKQRGDVSGTTLAMAYTTWAARPLLEKSLRAGRDVLEPNRFLHQGYAGAQAFFFNPGIKDSPILPRMDDDLRLNAAEVAHITTKATPRRRQLSIAIDTSRWYEDQSKAKRQQNERAYASLWADTKRALRLGQHDDVYLTEMVRAVVARPATDPGEQEFLTYREAMAALKLIKRNAESSSWPTHGGAINGGISRAALARLKEVGFPLQRNDGTKRPVESWDEWVDVMLSETFSNDVTMRGYIAVTNIVDGLLYEYRKDVKGLPATVDTREQGFFAAIRTRSGLMIASPILRRQFDAPGAQSGEVIYDIGSFDSADWEFDELPQDARDIVERRMATWEANNELTRKRQSPRREAIRGAQHRESLAKTNVLMRFAELGYVLKTFLNPGLWVGAFVELFNRGMQESVVSLLSGENLGAQGFTDAQRQQWNDTVQRLAENPKFYSMVYAHTNYQNQMFSPAITKGEQILQRWTTMAAAVINDPTWGVRSKTLAKAFMEAAWDSVNTITDERSVSVEQFLDALATDPELLNQISADAVVHGYSRIEYRRNLQDNLAERARRSIVEGIINSGGPGTNTLGTLFLRFPTMFFRFRSNTIINMLGLQGAHAVLASLMSDRTKRGGGLFDEDSVSEQARIEDSYDLTRAFIRTGVSHTQLLMLGMALSAAGFGGEDDEEKLLNKLRRYQTPIVAQDPRSLENDFRNAEAWFSDLLPAGMGVPSWIIRPYVSPAMGIARFSQTGDWRQVLWGFMDALGNMPLLNADNILNSWQTANELAAQAASESQDGSEEGTQRASKLLFTAVGTLEAMLFESSFASMIYQGGDEWDRDPYKFPMRDSNGVIQRYENGLPRAATMLSEYQKDDGSIGTGYLSRDDKDAQWRALAENRPVFAALASLIAHDSSYIRYNMVPKIREVDAQPLTEDEAAKIVVSVLNHETGAEELTEDGAAGVIRGVHLGAVAIDDPALQGIFIPKEMRADLQNRFLEELTQKYILLEYSKSEAIKAAKEEYYGQAYGEEEGLGLADIIWSDKIPAYQTQQYLQLNTTYVMGPNNFPIATGLKRSVLDAVGLNLEGLGIFQTYETGESSNMPTDQLLNSQDIGRGMNLGQRGLVKVDASWVPPTAEEIGKSIDDALADIADQLDDITDVLDGGFGRFGYGGYGGGGGGYSSRADYGGQAVRLNTPRGFNEPYALSPRVVNPTNPIIRRATVRRERFSSERGRLNPWQ